MLPPLPPTDRHNFNTRKQSHDDEFAWSRLRRGCRPTTVEVQHASRRTLQRSAAPTANPGDKPAVMCPSPACQCVGVGKGSLSPCLPWSQSTWRPGLVLPSRSSWHFQLGRVELRFARIVNYRSVAKRSSALADRFSLPRHVQASSSGLLVASLLGISRHPLCGAAA